MTGDDIKKITKVVKREINDALKPVNEKLDNHTKILIGHSAKLDNHTKILNKHSAKLNNHTASLMNIEHTLKGYGDMYKINKEENKGLAKRIDAVEEHLGITPGD